MQKEKKLVGVKRLDLDAAQGKAKKAQGEDKLQAVSQTAIKLVF